MARKNLIRTDSFSYHVTARCNNKDNFYISKYRVWPIFLKWFRYVIREYEVKIHAFVLMDNHFHLILTTPQANLDIVMYWIMKNVTLEIQKKSNRINRIFGSRYKWSVIYDDIYLHNVYRYVAQNPVKAGYCLKVEDYQFSTFYFLFRRTSCGFNVVPFFEFKNYLEYETWEWFNYKYSNQEYKILKSGLQRAEFNYKLGENKMDITPSNSFVSV